MLNLIKNSNKNIKSYFTEEELNNFKELVLIFMIPKIIWQTFRSDYPPQKSAEYIKSWLSFHYGYEWYYMNDEKCKKFIEDNFNNDFVKMYNDLPYGVMRSDVWRIAILYIYGGIYADLDIRCLKSLNDYIEKYDLIVSIEYPTEDIGNFCFAFNYCQKITNFLRPIAELFMDIYFTKFCNWNFFTK